MAAVKIGVVGLWHLGSVTAACLARKGFDVTGYDPNPEVVDQLNAGKAPLFEPGLDALIQEQARLNRLHFTRSLTEAISGSDLVWVTFDTPVDANDQADLPWLKENVRSLFPHLRSGQRLILSSQVPVGFCSEVETLLKEARPEIALPIAYSPENLRLGKALDIFDNPDRIVVGVRRPEDKSLFEPVFSAITPRIEWMKTESSEMTKHAINSFLAVSVAFTNELAVLCESIGADAREVERGLKTESRIGPRAYLKPGAAFAGGTLARDVQFLISLGQKYHQPSVLLNAILESNRRHMEWTQHKLTAHLKNLKGRRVAVLGLAYKEGTDTLRRSWAVELSHWLHQQGTEIQAFDWQLQQLPGDLSSIMSLKSQCGEALDNCDAAVIGTDHPGLRQIKTAEMQRLKNPLIIDPNGSLNQALLDSLTPIEYCSVGFALSRKNSR